jgi:hypothetical protein
VCLVIMRYEIVLLPHIDIDTYFSTIPRQSYKAMYESPIDGLIVSVVALIQWCGRYRVALASERA